MSVMPAGMRDTVILREARLFACQILRVLFDRQRIDICSHQNRPAILPAVNHAKDTAARYTEEIVSFSLSHYYLNPEFGAEPRESYCEMLGR